MQIYKDGQIGHYKQVFSSISFPAAGPSDEFLTTQGAYKVNVFKPHDRATQKLVASDPYVEGGWAYTVTVEDKTAEEIAADTAARAAQMRAQRDQLLAASDWRVIKALELGLTLDADWAAYRQALRDLPQQVGFPDVEMPKDPDWVEPVA